MTHERTARAIKVDAMVKRIDKMARGQQWAPEEGPIVLRNMLAKAPQTWWDLVAEEAGVNHPSDDSINSVLKIYELRTLMHVTVKPVLMYPRLVANGER